MNRFSRWVMHVRRASGPAGPVAVRLGLLAALIGLIAGLYLVQAGQMSVIGRNIEAMRAEYARLQRSNAELLGRIAQEGNIVRLQQRTAQKGFIPAEQVEYLIVPVATAMPGLTSVP